MKKILVVVDMQNDFVTGSLGSPEARAIVPVIKEKLDSGKYDYLYATRDLHSRKDFTGGSLEGEHFPAHCLIKDNGSDIIPELQSYLPETVTLNTMVVNKYGSFGANIILPYPANKVEEIELCGVCTDICVISNALDLRTKYPDARIVVDAKACAGTTPEKHEAALSVMESCLIEVVR